MKKIVLLVAAIAIATSPAAAATKHKKPKMTAEEVQMAKRDAEIAKQNELNYRAMRDALPLLLPSWSIPAYFSMQQDDKKKKK